MRLPPACGTLFVYDFPYQLQGRGSHGKYSLSKLIDGKGTIIFNKGLQAAIYVLESVGPLSSEGIRFMVAELKKQIAKTEDAYTPQLLMYIK